MADEAATNIQQLRSHGGGAADPDLTGEMVARSGGFRDGVRHAAQLVHDLMLELEPINPIANVVAATMNANLTLTGVEHVVQIDVESDDEDYRAQAFCSDDCGWSENLWHHADEYEAGDWESDPSGAADQAYAAAVAAGAAHMDSL